MKALTLIVLCLAISPCICFGQETDVPAEETDAPEAPDNSEAISALVRLTRDQEPAVRMTAFSALSQIGEQTPDVIAAVRAGLDDDEDAVRIEAFQTLISAIYDQEVRVGALLKLIGDDSEDLAVAASEHLGQLGKPAIPHLVKALQNEDQRVLVVQILGSIGNDARDAIPALTDLLKGADTDLRQLVATTLGQICNPQNSRMSGLTSSRSGRGVATIQRMMETVWPRYDTDGDGKLSPEEQAAFRGLDPSADQNGDRQITRLEFTTWYMNRYRAREPAPVRGGFGGAPAARGGR